MIRTLRPFALLSLGLAFVLAGCDATGPSSASVTVTGRITNSFDRPLEGATVSFSPRDEGNQSAFAEADTDADGRFSVEVPAGFYNAIVASPGYDPAAVPTTVGAEGGTDVTLALSGSASITMDLINAVTGIGVAGADLRCARQRMDGSYPDPETRYDFSALSDSTGTISVTSAPHGGVRCRVQLPGFSPSFFNATLSRSLTTGLPPVVIVPPPPAGALRIVLTWGQDPSDLDSHLTGPDGNGGRFHVYYANRSFGETNLDVDDTSSFGPETITIFPTAAGVFRYSVFNFSYQGAEGAASIADSPSRVEVHDHNGLVCSYTAPPAGQSGNTWRVFEATASASGGGFVMNAPCAPGAEDLAGMGYVTANGSSDEGSFLTLPPKHAGH